MSSDTPKKSGRKSSSLNKTNGPVSSRTSSVRRNVTLDDYPAIQVEGGLFTIEHVRKVAKVEAEKQSSTDYELPAGIDIKEEIGRGFRIASTLWKEFDSARQGPGDKSQATVRFVTQILKDCFGFTDVKETRPKIVSEVSYPIGRVAHGKAVPIIIIGAHQGLDSPDQALGDERRKRTASQLTQEYLNAEDACLWAICTNGLNLRILRDSDSLTRQSFFEANIERILGEQLWADFAVLWLHLNASRFKPGVSGVTSCPLELWHLAAQEEGSRVRDSLRIGVERAMVELGSGFLEHREGAKLRDALRTGTLKLEDYHQQILRLVYRMLFLFAVEDRKLLHPKSAKIEQIELYAEGYSLTRLRERSIKHCQDRYDDIWDSLRVTFRGLAAGQEALGLPPLGSLFAEEQCTDLVKNNISNKRLLNAVRSIAWFRENDALVPVNYKSMGTEELGSVYESLLELTPYIDESGKGFGFIKADEEEGKGNSRKTSGSYYTPDSLVQQLLDTTLNPVVAEKLKGKSTKEEKEKALLSITVIDPACGSGHFLLGAARRLAEKLASIRAEGGEATNYRQALRDVIASCIHGVDRNPMAIQLAKVALWLEGYVADKPLSFLDHHLVVGDSILSIIDLEMATKGIPDEAYDAITGDDKSIVRSLKALNKTASDSGLNVKQSTMNLFGGSTVDMGKSFAKIDLFSDETLDGVAKKVGQLEVFMKEAQADWRVTAAKLYVGAYLLPKIKGVRVPTSADILAAMNGENLKDLMPAVDAACFKARVLIWPLAFPHVFEKGGFDIVLGNPPWERLTLKEKEFFAMRSPKVANARNKAERQKEIDLLKNSPVGSPDHDVYVDFLEAKRISEVSSSFAHDLDRFPLTGQGDVNLYALFAENFLNLISPSGRAGFLAPTGIATDKSTSKFFSYLLDRNMVGCLFDFENKKALFKGVHKSFKFCLFTIGSEASPRFAFMLHDVADINDDRRVLKLTAEQMAKMNPNTKNAPIIRSARDAEIIAGVYGRLPVLALEVDDEIISNPWGIKFLSMFHMSADSDLFTGQSGSNKLPMFEPKMFNQYDHRWASFGNRKSNSDGDIEVEYTSTDFKSNFDNEVEPQYYVERDEVIRRLCFVSQRDYAAMLQSDSRVLLGYINKIKILPKDSSDKLKKLFLLSKDMKNYESIHFSAQSLLSTVDSIEILIREILSAIAPRYTMCYRTMTNSTNVRSSVFTFLPLCGCNNNGPFLFTTYDSGMNSVLLAQFNSLPFDYIIRNKIGGHLTYGYLYQMPTLTPDMIQEVDLKLILPRVLELVYTSHSIRSYYEDLVSLYPFSDGREHSNGEPFPFDEDRRLALKAELDAIIAYKMGFSLDELRFILDPVNELGIGYPSETFRGLRDSEIKKFGEYRTQRLVLEAWDRIVEPLRRGQS